MTNEQTGILFVPLAEYPRGGNAPILPFLSLSELVSLLLPTPPSPPSHPRRPGFFLTPQPPFDLRYGDTTLTPHTHS